MRYCLLALGLAGLLAACGPREAATEAGTTETTAPPVDEDDLLLRLSAYLSTDTTRVAREQNALANYAIERMLDVQVSESGLFYGVVAPGDGEAIEWGDYLTVHYRGYLPDGTVFGDSRRDDRPLSLYVGNMIDAWNEGVQYVNVGGRLLLLVPSRLGYGPEGLKTAQGRVIVPPHQLLIFEVEVLEKTQPENG